MRTARIPVLCGAIGLAASQLKAKAGVRGFDPALIYILFPAELRGFEPGTRVVDLTNVPQPTTSAAWALSDLMEEREMDPIPFSELPRVIEAWHAAHPGYLGKPSK